MHDLPEFDEIYVISDLHMGGQPGFQMLGQVARLGRFITYLATVRPGERVALIINGDVIDSLAEDIPGYLATHDAGAMMEGIYRRFTPVWDGLASFVGAEKRHLVLVTGNHDIEMALPGVERSIRRRLTGGDAARNGAITFATHGGGYACMVGGARVFCTHGNEVDPWNVIDYDRLGQVANALNAGRDIDHERWTPNAGTRMVVDVMNKVKRKYPFVDLLKPEDKIVVPVLVTLDPGLVRGLDFRAARRIGPSRRRGKATVHDLLGAADGLDIDAELEELLDGTTRSGSATADPNTWLLEAEHAIREGKELPEPEEIEGGTLGWVGMALDRALGVDKIEALRRALKAWLADDPTFELDYRDETFERIVARTGPAVDFIVTGHTHLERAIALDDGRVYYNSGTWVRLVRLPKHLLADSKVFAEVFKVLAAGTMEALDEPRFDGKPLVLESSAAVRIATEPGGVRSQLLRVGDGLPKPVAKSEFFKP